MKAQSRDQSASLPGVSGRLLLEAEQLPFTINLAGPQAARCHSNWTIPCRRARPLLRYRLIFLRRLASQLLVAVGRHPLYRASVQLTCPRRAGQTHTCRVFVCIDVEMSRANVVCANVYIKIRSTGRCRARRQKPGACPDERCHNAFFVGDDGRSTLERTTYERGRRHDCLLVNGHRARHYRTHFAIYRYATRCGMVGKCVQCRRWRSRVTAFYGRVIRSVTADRVIDVRPSVRLSVCQTLSRSFNFFRTPLSDHRRADSNFCLTTAISTDISVLRRFTLLSTLSASVAQRVINQEKERYKETRKHS